MPKISYVEKNFSPSSMRVIEQANEIIDEYVSDGLTLTLRQLYYQFVSRDLVANKQSEYKRIGSIINDARLAGYIDWEAIEDRTRNLSQLSRWTDPGQIIRAAAQSFHMDHWKGQLYRVEVWIEKEALTGVIAGICDELDVPYFACRGYVSQSEMWVAAKRLGDYAYEETQQPVIIHLGDHDPSGVDMTRDILDRQNLFMSNAEIKRIALNMEQIESYTPPPNPAKLTDSRCQAYISEYGDESWELDALEPRVLRDLIREEVLNYRDEEIYQDVLRMEREYLDVLSRVEQNWRNI